MNDSRVQLEKAVMKTSKVLENGAIEEPSLKEHRTSPKKIQQKSFVPLNDMFSDLSVMKPPDLVAQSSECSFISTITSDSVLRDSTYSKNDFGFSKSDFMFSKTDLQFSIPEMEEAVVGFDKPPQKPQRQVTLTSNDSEIDHSFVKLRDNNGPSLRSSIRNADSVLPPEQPKRRSTLQSKATTQIAQSLIAEDSDSSDSFVDGF